MRPTFYTVFDESQGLVRTGITEDRNGCLFVGGIYIGHGQSPVVGGFFTDDGPPFNQIIVKQGLAANLPVLAIGELGYATDTKVLYVGTGTANVAVASSSSGGGSVVGTPGNLSGQTTTQTVTTYTVGASNETLTATGSLAITGISIGAMSFAVTFTDIHGTPQSLNGTMAYSTGVPSYNALAFGEFWAQAGTTVNIVATISSGACTYDTTGTITKLR